MSIRSFLCVALILASFAVSADPVRFSGSLRLRAEHWSWFETPGFEDEYTFAGALLRASAAQQVSPNFDWQAELAAPALLSLPDRAIAPAPRGQLGLGGSYFAANDGEENVISLFPKQAFARFRSGGHMLRAGRFEFSDGTEVVPANPALAAVKGSRVAHRLVGNFGFSHVGRSADGIHYAHNAGGRNVTAVVFRPTVGAFDVEGLRQLDDVGVAYGSVTFSRPNAEQRIFAIGYRDSRGVLKVDNRPAGVRALDREDITVATIGGHVLAAWRSADVLLWSAMQVGDWGSQKHRASAVDLEAGYRFAGTAKPALRAGYFRSSGDADPSDRTHGTFFQILPTPRIYARLPFYNAMNSTDTFLMASIKPLSSVTIAAEAHLLRLTERRDLWYAGGGAFEKETFGFAGRPSSGRSGLGRVVDVSVDHALSPKMNWTLYAGVARGGDVVRSIYEGDVARFVYLELVRRF